MIVCGATIRFEELKAKFESSLKCDTPGFFDFKYFKYEITLDNIFHYYTNSSKVIIFIDSKQSRYGKHFDKCNYT